MMHIIKDSCANDGECTENNKFMKYTNDHNVSPFSTNKISEKHCQLTSLHSQWVCLSTSVSDSLSHYVVGHMLNFAPGIYIYTIHIYFSIHFPSITTS